MVNISYYLQLQFILITFRKNQIMNSWKIVFSTNNPFEVNLAKTYLESEGIKTIIQNELAAQIYASVIDKPKLLVREEDLEKARKILIEADYIKT